MLPSPAAWQYLRTVAGRQAQILQPQHGCIDQPRGWSPEKTRAVALSPKLRITAVRSAYDVPR
jgi:hypothetical protein